MKILKRFCPFCLKLTQQIIKGEPFGHSGICRKCKNKVSGTEIIR